MSSTVSSTYILEALGAPIPPSFLFSWLEWLFRTSQPPYPSYPVGSLFNKYEPQLTEGLRVWPWRLLRPGHWPSCPCCCQRCRDIPSHNPPPYVEPSEDSEEYYEEEYGFAEYTPIFEPEDTFENGPEDDETINTIKILANVSSAPRCILDSGANCHETWLEGTSSLPLTPSSTPIHGISGSLNKVTMLNNLSLGIRPLSSAHLTKTMS